MGGVFPKAEPNQLLHVGNRRESFQDVRKVFLIQLGKPRKVVVLEKMIRISIQIFPDVSEVAKPFLGHGFRSILEVFQAFFREGTFQRELLPVSEQHAAQKLVFPCPLFEDGFRIFDRIQSVNLA